MRLALVTAVLLSSCGPVGPQSREPTVTPLPSFELVDVNPASRSAGQLVGPLAVRGKVTGWYFTHSS